MRSLCVKFQPSSNPLLIDVGEDVTLLKAFDGTFITWDIVMVSNEVERLMSMPTKTILEVVQAKFIQGYRLVIEDFKLVYANVDEEI